MFCSFLLYSRVNQPYVYIYIYIYIPSFLDFLPTSVGTSLVAQLGKNPPAL